jgi:DNA polymerase-4
VAAIVPDIEDRGIDEIYLDLTDHPEETRALGMRLKNAVQEATGLTCSIGIAPNKLLAKICSDLEKPDGLTIVSLDDVPDRIWPLPAKKINGIGPKAAAKLSALGIETVGQVAAADPKLLQEYFGLNYAEWLRRVSHGHDEREGVTRSDPKGISRETTFERDLHAKHDRDTLSEIFTRLCTKLADDLERKRYAGRTVGIKLRYADFRTVTRDVTLPAPVADAAAIRRAAGECLRRVPLDQRLRLLGVRVSALVPLEEIDRFAVGQQGELFEL